ncbi:MAG: antibiotic biosynthesis monooxygenase [Ktedonobacteraceae bacterium]|nr:antibiotic biosynthesis monooxygenase [Ktedonobacteraceae bacterium]
MITEVAIFTAIPGKEEALGQAMIQGLETIRQHPECVSANSTRCIEKPGRYLLSVNWTSLDAHIKDFRNGPLFIQWRSYINGLTEGSAEVFHYEAY